MELVRKYDDFASEFLGNIEEILYCTLLYIMGGSNVFMEVFKEKGKREKYATHNTLTHTYLTWVHTHISYLSTHTHIYSIYLCGIKSCI